MFKKTILLILPFILYCCSDIKKVEYSDLIFVAEDDGLTHTDQLKLYANDIFEIHILDLDANGTYTNSEDTIILYYIKYKGDRYQDFIVENNFVYELVKTNNQWSVVSNKYDTSMMIYRNKLNQD